MTIRRAKQVLRVSHRSATLALQRLVDAGLLVEVPPAGRTRLLLSSGIIQTVNS